MLTPLQNLHVLLVEDEAIVAMLEEDMLLDLGAARVTLAARLNEGQEIAQEAQIDFAVLDVNLGGERSYPIAEILKERGIPCLFATGYGISGHDEGWQGSPTLQKPFGINDLAKAIQQAVARGRIA